MLESMKKGVGKWVLRLLMILLIISFAAWGIGDYIGGPTELPDIATVGDETVTARQFDSEWRQEMNRLRQAFGPDIEPEQARQLGAADRVLDGIINRHILGLGAHDLGIVVGDDQVRLAIASEPAFRGVAGEFDQLAYLEALQRLGTTEARFVSGLRTDLRQSHLTGAIGAGAVAPAGLTDLLYRYRAERRKADVVVVPRDAVADPGTPSDGDLRKFHSENKALFTSPELRSLTAILLEPADLAESVQPSEGEIQTEYEVRLSSLSVPERRRMQQILAPNEDAAKRIVQALREGRSFETVAKDLGIDGATSDDFGLVTKEDVPVELADAVFSIEKDKPSDPVQTGFGWHILRVSEIQLGRKPALAEVRDRIVADLAREKAIDTVVTLSQELEDIIASGASLEEAAGQLNIRTLVSEAMDPQGRDKDGKDIDGLPEDKARFLETVADAETGEPSLLTETRNGGAFIVRVDKIVDPQLKPYETVKDNVAKAWRQAQRNNAAKLKAEQMLEKIKGGASLASVAADEKLDVKPSGEFTRFQQQASSTLPDSLRTALFDDKIGDTEIGPAESGYAIATLTEIIKADPSAEKQRLDELNARLRVAMANDILAQFTEALKTDHPVDIDRQAFDAFFTYDPVQSGGVGGGRPSGL